MATEKAPNNDTREGVSFHNNPSPSHSNDSHLEYGKPRAVDNTDSDEEFSYEEQRKIVHRIDRRLVVIGFVEVHITPLSCADGRKGLMYCVSLIDRGNMPNAAIAGMHTDQQTNVGYRYSIATLVFFVTYTIFQPPATIVTRKLGPRNFLPTICVAWGIVMIGFGFINDWIVLIPCAYSWVSSRPVTFLVTQTVSRERLELTYGSGCVYLISTYYSRFDIQKRYTFFYLIGTLCNGLSGVLAYGLQQMDGIAGYGGWRWIFIIEGIMTVLIGLAGYIFVVDFLDQIAQKPAWSFLKPNETAFLLRRINRDRNDADAEPFNFRKWLASGADPKIWSFALIFFSLCTSAYAISFFLPIILPENMGYSTGEAQYLPGTPYGLACIAMWTLAWIGDRYRIRGPLLLVNVALGLIGALLLGWAVQAGVRYLGTFLICASAQGGIPTCMAYQANNIRGHWKRAFCSATTIGFGGIGGIAGSLIFRTQDRSTYRPGIYGVLACNDLVIVCVGVNSV